MMRFIMLVIGVGLIVALGVLIDQRSELPVERPKRISRPNKVYALGRVEGLTPEILMRFEKEGRVVEILVSEGQVVNQGDVLIRQDDAEYLHEVAVAQAQLSLARAQLERVVNGARPQERTEARALHMAKMAELEGVRRNWQRIEGLLRENAISQQDADDLRSRLDQLHSEVEAAKARLELLEAPPRPDELAMAQARVASAQAQVDVAEHHLEQTRLRALRDGQVLNIDVEVGELTGPSAAQPVIILADTSRYRVRAFVEELDALKLAVGMQARVTADALGETIFEGRLVQLSPQMGRKQLWDHDPAERYDTKTREIWVDLDEKPAELIVGLPVDVIIDPTSNEPSASTVPAGARVPRLAPMR